MRIVFKRPLIILRFRMSLPTTSSSESRKRPSPWDQKGPSTSSSTAVPEPAVKKRLIPENAAPLEGMTKAELQAALKLGNQSFKDLRDIAKRLERFPPISKESEIDGSMETSDLVMKKYTQPQVFCCYRCDHTKTSNMKAKYRGQESICGSCFDHLTRCVIPYKGLPDYQKPQRCIHKVPKTYQKMYR